MNRFWVSSNALALLMTASLSTPHDYADIFQPSCCIQTMRKSIAR